MAVSTSALDLLTWAKMSKDPGAEKVAWSLYEHGNVLQDIPLVTKKTIKVSGVRWANDLPDVTWASLNEEPTTVTGSPETFQEQQFRIRNIIATDVDMMEDENNITDPRGARVDAYLKSVTYDFNYQFIANGPVAGNAKAITGLRWRLDNPSKSGVAASGGTSLTKVDAGAVDVTLTNMGKLSALKFLEKFRNVLTKMKAPDGKGVVAYMDEALYDRFPAICAMAGEAAGFSSTRDNYDREVTMYRQCRLQVIGVKKDQTTSIITTTEDAAGADGASTHTSIYFARYGQGKFWGWQNRVLRPNYLGVTDNGVTDQVVFNWGCGLVMEDNRSIGRLYGIKMA